MVDAGIEMPGTGARSPKRGSWDHQRGARKLDLAGFCYRFATKNGAAVVVRLWGKAVTLGYTTHFATAAYGEQVEPTLPAITGRWRFRPHSGHSTCRGNCVVSVMQAK